MRALLLLATAALLIPACGADESDAGPAESGTTASGTTPSDPPADAGEIPQDTPETPAPETTTVTLDVEGMT
jgi:hypothetical protein